MEVVDALLRLNEIFQLNNWHPKDVGGQVFTKFGKLLGNLSEDKERELIIELAEKYSWITLADYQNMIIKTFDSIDDAKLNGVKKIYIFPIIKLEDENQVKSGHAVMYMLKGIKSFMKKYDSIEFKLLTEFKQFDAGEFKLGKNELVILVDDYVGSGETIDACLVEIMQRRTIQYSDVNVLSIVTQSNTYSKLQGKGISVYTASIEKRGITDYNASPDLEKKIGMMLSIEKMITTGSFFSLGYNDSEALVTLLRTPDNTFPIFWKEYKKNGKKFQGPFFRIENI